MISSTGSPRLADELVRLKVDVLITPGTPAALAAKNATRTIPIVFTDVTDPVAAGLVDSLARPGGKHHGVHRALQAVLAGKRLELLKETVPKLSRVAAAVESAGIQALRNNGKKANWRHGNWACSFIPWR